MEEQRVHEYSVYSTNHVPLPDDFFVSPKWDSRFINLAKHVSGWSKDPATKVGAVIVNGNRKVVFGYNGFPSGIDDTASRYSDYDLKHKLVLHAEENAIANASHNLEGHTLYVTYFPCEHCAMQIIAHKIKRVVTLQLPKNKAEKYHSRAVLVMKYLREAGVRCDILVNVWGE